MRSQWSERPTPIIAPSNSGTPQGALACGTPAGSPTPPAGSFFGLLDPHPRHRAGIGREEIDRAAVARREHHALRLAETHLARREVRDQHGEPANELLGRISGANPGEDRALVEADVERELQELVGVGHELGLDDARDAKV